MPTFAKLTGRCHRIDNDFSNDSLRACQRGYLRCRRVQEFERERDRKTSVGSAGVVKCKPARPRGKRPGLRSNEFVGADGAARFRVGTFVEDCDTDTGRGERLNGSCRRHRFGLAMSFSRTEFI